MYIYIDHNRYLHVKTCPSCGQDASGVRYRGVNWRRSLQERFVRFRLGGSAYVGLRDVCVYTTRRHCWRGTGTISHAQMGNPSAPKILSASAAPLQLHPHFSPIMSEQLCHRFHHVTTSKVLRCLLQRKTKVR